MTARTPQRKLKSLHEKPERMENYTVRFGETDYARLVRAANRYTEGNVSEWIRYSALHFVPDANDLETTMERK